MSLLPNACCVQHPPRSIRIGGVAPYSSSDYPGQLAAVIFIQGCPWRCAYCHNPHLQPRRLDHAHDWADVLQLLQRRIGLLDGVVFSGGEPTIDPFLTLAVHQVKDMGFKVGMHTAGMYPQRLQALLPLLDWLGLDIKTDFQAYDALTGVKNSHLGPQRCLHLLQHSQLSYECRTTIHPALHSPETILTLAQQLKQYKVEHFALQVFRPQGCQNTALNATGQAMIDYPSHALCQQLGELFPQFTLRPA